MSLPPLSCCYSQVSSLSKTALATQKLYAEYFVFSPLWAYYRENTLTCLLGGYSSPDNTFRAPGRAQLEYKQSWNQTHCLSVMTQTVPQAQHNLAHRTATIALPQHIHAGCAQNIKVQHVLLQRYQRPHTISVMYPTSKIKEMVK